MPRVSLDTASPERDDMTGIEQEIGMLADLPRSDLVKRWQDFYGVGPPKGISRQLMIRAIAYELQAKTFGGLKPAVVRQLQKIAAGLVTGAPVAIKTAFKLKPGARLVREWNGITHVVEVVDDGFIWNGERHLSLSAIARTITGARWSGPRFFGLPSGGVP
jgi:hypothetical protein